MHSIESLIYFLVTGIVAGFLASKIVNKSGEGLIGDLVLGIIGAVVGGEIISLIGIASGGLIWSVVVATAGAILVLIIYHAIVGKGGRSAA